MGYKEKFQGESMNRNVQQPVQQQMPGPIMGYQQGQPNYVDRTLDNDIDVFKKMLLTGAMVNQAVANVNSIPREYNTYIDSKSESEVVDEQYREGKMSGVVIIGVLVLFSALKHVFTGA